ncbi:phosphoadenosine phosphosulfate reductase family protein [Burkholderia cepacia]|uniref:phosphoadenosine phosphosulfate reductase domain-containing protein n=1 Tax=Burkholderia cepacia TaxID=292 RepID=UPI001F2EFBDB|nr:phosphoadenosine phosphosulfate reductase family protein [Burkholderia cepacia]MCE4125777.1 phosphoadenosine phosphosulfate reductase family protein [Burkholderia cepacia]
MNVISASYGNDSIATIQWAREREMRDVVVVFIDTGWSKPGWLDRVAMSMKWVEGLGFEAVIIRPTVQFEDLIRMKKGFPSQRFQWCSGMLKGVPFLTWIDDRDPQRTATVIIGKRREESEERANTPEFIEQSEYHGDRRVWHPLYMHTEAQRNELIARAGFEVLPHRSKECSPCINANKADIRDLSQWEIDRLKRLETDVGKPMFRAKKHGGANGIEQVIQWSFSRPGKYDSRQEPLFNGCSSGYCGY